MPKPRNEDAINRLSQKGQEIVNELSAPIMGILQKIIDATDLNTGEIKLSGEALCMLAIRLPAECGFLQAKINNQTIRQRLRDISTQNAVTDQIVLLRETGGDARERQRRAEAYYELQMMTDETQNQIIQALQQVIIRADKAYEGIKKIIDARNREWNFDRKPGYSATT